MYSKYEIIFTYFAQYLVQDIAFTKLNYVIHFHTFYIIITLARPIDHTLCLIPVLPHQPVSHHSTHAL